MKDKAEYKTKETQQDLRLVKYLKEKGFQDEKIYQKIGLSRPAFIKRKVDPKTFTWAQVKGIAEHLNISIQTFIEKFLD